MTSWLDSAGRFFNPDPRVGISRIGREQVCVVVDDALSNPEGLVDWAASQSFEPVCDSSYPGQVLGVPAAIAKFVGDHFAQYARRHLRARRTQTMAVRLSLVTVPPAELEPVQ
jgi:hypothetical protein